MTTIAASYAHTLREGEDNHATGVINMIVMQNGCYTKHPYIE